MPKLDGVTLLPLGLYPHSGGPAKSVAAFRTALDANVISWVGSGPDATQGLIWDDGLAVETSGLPFFKQLQIPLDGSTAGAEELIARSSLVSVHSFWRWHIKWIHKVCTRHNVPYWYVPHGSLDPYVLRGTGAVAKNLYLKTIGGAFLRDAATVIYSTEREKEKARAIVGHDRAEVVRWPLNESDFAPRDKAARARTRDRLGIPDQAVCFLYLGRLATMKRPVETIEAFAKSGLEDAHLVVVGNEFGVTVDECRQAAIASGAADRIHVVGPAYGDEKHDYLSASDVYVSLSERENFNFTAAEALAAGLPVILSPGNDLARDIESLDGVWALRDLAPDTVKAAFADAAAKGADELAYLGLSGANWAQVKLRGHVFADAIRDVASRYARSVRPVA